jgi:nucleoside-diphosphate-sugar epimerase
MNDQRILVTGPTGKVALPLTKALARDNDVWGLARFRSEAPRAELEAVGVTCVAEDLADCDLSSLPDDFDYILNLAVVRGGEDAFDYDIAANAESVGLLMQRWPHAKAFLHCSSTAVYQLAGHHKLEETDPLGDSHRMFTATYSLCKIAAEAVARTGARQFGLPTTVARLNVPYGPNGGLPTMHLDAIVNGATIPVHPDKPNLFNPIYEDDIIEQVPLLLAIASVPATIVNWAGRDQVSVEEWCAYLAEITGREAKLDYVDWMLSSVTTDNTKMHEMIGPTKVDWRDGMDRMVRQRYPELLEK